MDRVGLLRLPQDSCTALLVIDMQQDFCALGGYAHRAGLDVSLLRRPIPNISKLLSAARQKGLLVIFTREGHRPDLSDCPATKLERSNKAGSRIGTPGPLGRLLIRGEQGHDIIHELKPESHEIIIDKPMYDAFYQTDLDIILRTRSVKSVIMTGVTTSVCVTSTLRSAVERGFQCYTVGDACACGDQKLHEAALGMTEVEGGLFGTVVSTDKVLAAIDLLPD